MQTAGVQTCACPMAVALLMQLCLAGWVPLDKLAFSNRPHAMRSQSIDGQAAAIWVHGAASRDAAQPESIAAGL